MQEFTRLVKLMESLRAEDGCAWDRKQTESAFRTFLLEEVYEAIDAIEKNDYPALMEELGDLLFHIVFIAQICKEKQQFDIADVIRAVYEKMYSRHPHVFGDKKDGKPVEKRWEELKKAEKKDYSPVAHTPEILPALLHSYVISRRAARTGFDWEKLEDIYEKMYEEIRELKEAEGSGDNDKIEEEIGDLLFTISNIARFHGIDPEAALRRTNEKFIRRFSHIEAHTDVTQADLKTMDALWNEIKRREKKGK